MKNIGIVLATMMVFTAQAQVNKCVNPKTKVVTYSDTFCDTAQKSTFIEGRKSEEDVIRIQMQADEANERKYRAQQSEAQSQQSVQQRMPSQQASSDKSSSYECRLAQKNHATTVSASSGSSEQRRGNANDSIKIVNKACGTETEMIQAPVKKSVARNEPEPELEPFKKEMNSRPSITDCSGGTCRDRDNNRYTVTDRNNLKREDGANCQYSGGAWNCR
jgi:hypothetical protein